MDESRGKSGETGLHIAIFPIPAIGYKGTIVIVWSTSPSTLRFWEILGLTDLTKAAKFGVCNIFLHIFLLFTNHVDFDDEALALHSSLVWDHSAMY